jgi:hypothetical protein
MSRSLAEGGFADLWTENFFQLDKNLCTQASAGMTSMESTNLVSPPTELGGLQFLQAEPIRH